MMLDKPIELTIFCIILRSVHVVRGIYLYSIRRYPYSLAKGYDPITCSSYKKHNIRYHFYSHKKKRIFHNFEIHKVYIMELYLFLSTNMIYGFDAITLRQLLLTLSRLLLFIIERFNNVKLSKSESTNFDADIFILCIDTTFQTWLSF